MTARPFRIGTGAAYSEDRIDPGVDMAARGDLDYLVFECLAERTLALAQVRRLRQGPGFDPWLEERFRQIVPVALARGTRIVSNMGAADPAGAENEEEAEPDNTDRDRECSADRAHRPTSRGQRP